MPVAPRWCPLVPLPAVTFNPQVAGSRPAPVITLSVGSRVFDPTRNPTGFDRSRPHDELHQALEAALQMVGHDLVPVEIGDRPRAMSEVACWVSVTIPVTALIMTVDGERTSGRRYPRHIR